MTNRQLTSARYCLSQKVRTFYKGDEFYDLITWIMDNVDTVNVGSTGCQISNKISVSVKLLNDGSANYSKKPWKMKGTKK